MSTQKEQIALLQSLIQAGAGVTSDDPRFTAVFADCKQVLDHHTFLDTYPETVDADWSETLQRINDNGQLEKSALLNTFRDALLADTDLASSTQRDFPYRVASLLLGISRNPLNTYTDASGLALAQKIEQAAEAAARSDDVTAALVEQLSSDSEAEFWQTYGTYSPGDSLSEWSGEEREEDDLESLVEEGDEKSGKGDLNMTSRDAVNLAAPDGSYEYKEHFHTPLAVSQRKVRHPRTSPRHTGQRGHRPRYGPTSLSVWLAAKDSGGHPARQLDPRRCFTDKELVLQVVDMLKGIKEPGAAFYYDLESLTYHPRKGVHTANTPTASTESLLARFATLATSLAQLQSFCDALMLDRGSADPVKGSWSGLGGIPTVAAFAVATRSHLRAIQSHLISMESDLKADVKRDGAEPEITLLSLRLALGGVEGQTHALAAIVNTIHAKIALENPGNKYFQAFVATAVVNAVHESLNTVLQSGLPQGGVVAGILGEIFLAILKPTLDALDDWLDEGSLAHAPPEFFVHQEQQQVGDDCSQGLWTRLYTLKTSSQSMGLHDGSHDDDVLLVPRFLAPIAAELLEAGLAALAVQQVGVVAEEEEHVSEKHSLHELFTQRVKDILSDRHMLSTSDEDMSCSESSGVRTPKSRGASPTTILYPEPHSKELDPETSVQEWMTATGRSNSTSTARVPFEEDIPDLLAIPQSILDLSAVSAVMDVVEPSKMDDKRGIHHIGVTMRKASTARRNEVEASGIDAVLAEFQYHGIHSNVEELHESGNVAIEQNEDEDSIERVDASNEPFEWTHYLQKVSSQLDRCVLFTHPNTNRVISPYNTPPSFVDGTHSAFKTHRGSSVLAWVNAPPLHAITDQALLIPLQQRISHLQSIACSRILSSTGGILDKQLTLLQGIATLSCPSLESFVDFILTRCSTPRGVDGVSVFELNARFQEALEVSTIIPGHDETPVSALGPLLKDVHVTIVPATSLASTNTLVESLARLQMNLQAAPPLSLVSDTKFLFVHTEIATLMLQLQWVQALLHSSAARDRKNALSVDRAQLCAKHSMHHFVSAIQQYLIYQVQAAFDWLKQSLYKATSMRTMMETCLEYCEKLQKGCCLLNSVALSTKYIQREGEENSSSDGDISLHGRAQLMAALNAALQYCITLRQLRKIAASDANEERDGSPLDLTNKSNYRDGGGEEENLARGDQKLVLKQQLAATLQAHHDVFVEARKQLFDAVAKQSTISGIRGEAARQLMTFVDVDGRMRAC